MKIVALASSIITVLLMLSTMICGLWISANNITDPGSFDFHVNCGMASVVFSLITMVLIIVMFARLRKRG